MPPSRRSGPKLRGSAPPPANRSGAINPLDRVPPYRIYRDLLPQGEHEALIDWALANEARFEPSGLGPEGRLDPLVRHSMGLRGEGGRPWVKGLADRVRAMVPEWQAAFGIEAFAISEVELDMIAYNHGAFYGRHIDTGIGSQRLAEAEGLTQSRKARMITAVYYFHREPKGFDGGALRLHSIARGAAFVDLPPQQNSLAVFPSWAPHEVMPVTCSSARFEDSRFAVNCWVR